MGFEIRWRSINHDVKMECEVLVNAYCEHEICGDTSMTTYHAC